MADLVWEFRFVDDGPSDAATPESRPGAATAARDRAHPVERDEPEGTSRRPQAGQAASAAGGPGTREAAASPRAAQSSDPPRHTAARQAEPGQAARATGPERQDPQPRQAARVGDAATASSRRRQPSVEDVAQDTGKQLVDALAKAPVIGQWVAALRDMVKPLLAARDQMAKLGEAVDRQRTVAEAVGRIETIKLTENRPTRAARQQQPRPRPTPSGAAAATAKATEAAAVAMAAHTVAMAAKDVAQAAKAAPEAAAGFRVTQPSPDLRAAWDKFFRDVAAGREPKLPELPARGAQLLDPDKTIDVPGRPTRPEPPETPTRASDVRPEAPVPQAPARASDVQPEPPPRPARPALPPPAPPPNGGQPEIIPADPANALTVPRRAALVQQRGELAPHVLPLRPIPGAAGAAGAGGAGAVAAGGSALATAVAIGVGVVAVAGTALVAYKLATAAIERFAREVAEATERIAPFSIAVAGSIARNQVLRLREDIMAARQLGGRVAAFNDANASLARSVQRIEDAITGDLLNRVTPIANATAKILEWLTKDREGLEKTVSLGLDALIALVGGPLFVFLSKLVRNTEPEIELPDEADIFGFFNMKPDLTVRWGGRTFAPAGQTVDQTEFEQPLPAPRLEL